MNEQLIVKNFGPIKDATVDFKKVTVFIGPTGGGKSTLAKLAAIFSTSSYCTQTSADSDKTDKNGIRTCLSDYSIEGFKKDSSYATLISDEWQKFLKFDTTQVAVALQDEVHNANMINYERSNKLVNQAENILFESNSEKSFIKKQSLINKAISLLEEASSFRELSAINVMIISYRLKSLYIPSDRSFISSISSSFAGLMRDDIGLPKPLLNFANSFFQFRNDINKLEIPFLEVSYFRHDNKDFISFAAEESALQLHEAASGIQSVTPMLVLLDHLSQQKEQAQSFIIEEPELNLYPTAQQGLLNWLVEKCTKNENDLTITTHSPYILSHLNLLLYAYQVAEKHPNRADDVAKIVPRESWINPKEFSCYHVEGQKENGVHSIVNPETGLISYNGLDSTATAEATEFEKLLDINAGLEVE